MEQQANTETWQVEVGGQVYDAMFEDLGQWIGDGALQPGDKVRKGDLRWIEARKVPVLLTFFNAKASGEMIPAIVTKTNSPAVSGSQSSDLQLPANETLINRKPADTASLSGTGSASFTTQNANVCSIHAAVASAFICIGCSKGFCKTCPNSYGGTVKICPTCGSMCRAVGELQTEQARSIQISAAISEGFGFSDFINAIKFPFRFKASLFFGAAMFAIFSVSRSATALGGTVMFASAIICLMLANTLTFGILANTVTNFAHGDLEANFMPAFDDFSLWDDVVHPFFLSIGVYISSFGPFLLTFLIGAYLVISSVSSQMITFRSEVERLPGTQYYQGRETVEQSQQVKRVLGNITDEHDKRIGEYNGAATANSSTLTVAPTPDEAEEIWQAAQESRRKELEAAFGKTQETREKESGEFLAGLLKLAAPLVVIGGIAFLWGMFYFAAACAVAGYTRSFTATINPLVGLDTIKRLGLDYVKIMVMGITLVLVSACFGGLFGLIFAPLDLPGMGNLVAKGFSSLITFYLAVVFACIIGYALFKNSDKLQLLR
jgi:hypothetical protein